MSPFWPSFRVWRLVGRFGRRAASGRIKSGDKSPPAKSPKVTEKTLVANGHLLAQHGGDPAEDALPISSPVPPEEPHRRIPGTVVRSSSHQVQLLITAAVSMNAPDASSRRLPKSTTGNRWATSRAPRLCVPRHSPASVQPEQRRPPPRPASPRPAPRSGCYGREPQCHLDRAIARWMYSTAIPCAPAWKAIAPEDARRRHDSARRRGSAGSICSAACSRPAWWCRIANVNASGIVAMTALTRSAGRVGSTSPRGPSYDFAGSRRSVPRAVCLAPEDGGTSRGVLRIGGPATPERREPPQRSRQDAPYPLIIHVQQSVISPWCSRSSRRQAPSGRPRPAGEGRGYGCWRRWTRGTPSSLLDGELDWRLGRPVPPADPGQLARPVNESSERRDELPDSSTDPGRLARPVNESSEPKWSAAMSPEPYYEPNTVTPCYKLRYGWAGWPTSGTVFPEGMERHLLGACRSLGERRPSPPGNGHFS